MRPIYIFTFFTFFLSTISQECSRLQDCICTTSLDCKLTKFSLCNTTARTCIQCRNNSDCSHLFAYPYYASCNADRVCENCLGGCDPLDLTATFHQMGSNPNLIKILFSRAAGLTAEQLRSMISIKLSRTLAGSYSYNITKVDESKFFLELVPDSSMVKQTMKLDFLVSAAEPTSIIPLEPVYSAADYEAAYQASDVLMGFTITGLVLSFLLYVTKKNKRMMWAYIQILQVNYYMNGFQVSIPLTQLLNIRAFELTRVLWFPNFVATVADSYGGLIEDGLKFNYEAMNFKQNFFYNIGSFLSLAFIVFDVYLILSIAKIYLPPEHRIVRFYLGFKKLIAESKEELKRVLYFDFCFAAWMQITVAAKSTEVFHMVSTFLALLLIYVCGIRMVTNFAKAFVLKFRKPKLGKKIRGPFIPLIDPINLIYRFFLALVLGYFNRNLTTILIWVIVLNCLYLILTILYDNLGCKKSKVMVIVTQGVFFFVSILYVTSSNSNADTINTLMNVGNVINIFQILSVVFGVIMICIEWAVIIRKMYLARHNKHSKLQFRKNLSEGEKFTIKIREPKNNSPGNKLLDNSLAEEPTNTTTQPLNARVESTLNDIKLDTLLIIGPETRNDQEQEQGLDSVLRDDREIKTGRKSVREETIVVSEKGYESMRTEGARMGIRKSNRKVSRKSVR